MKVAALALICWSMGHASLGCKGPAKAPPASAPKVMAKPSAKAKSPQAPESAKEPAAEPAKKVAAEPAAKAPIPEPVKQPQADAAPAGAANPAPTAKKYPARAGKIGSLAYVERTFDPQNSGEVPVLVLIHGLGDTPEHFFRLTDPLTSPHRALALRGISEYSGSFGSGYAWFSTRVRDAKIKKLASEVNAAAAFVAKGLRALNRKEKRPKRKFYVTGFSQGGILSYALAVQYPELFHTAVPISGLLPPPSRRASKNKSTKILAFHGKEDQIVPYARARELGEWLRAQRYDYELKSFPTVGHRLASPMYESLMSTLNLLLQPKATP